MFVDSKIKVFHGDIDEDFNLKGDLAIDCESMGLKLSRDRLCVLQICDSDSNSCLVQFEPGEYNAPNLVKYLSDEQRVKIFHFGRFDMAMIQKYLNVTMSNIFCTKIASVIARTYTDRHGLKDLCNELLDVGISKHQQSSYWGRKKLHKPQISYAAGDVIYLHRIRKELIGILKREGRYEIVDKIFAFLKTRVELDLLGWDDIDIFAHSFSRK